MSEEIMMEGPQYRDPDKYESFLSDLEWKDADISGNMLDFGEKYERPFYTLSRGRVPFAPLGGIHGLTGQPGNGKTMIFTQLIVALLKGEFGDLRYSLTNSVPSPTVLYVDTEMEKGNTQLVAMRVYEMMGWEFYGKQDVFHVMRLREEVDAVDRYRKILKAIYELRPTVVFIDGLIDIIGDFNDNKECQKVIYQLMATASLYNVSLWCVLHENPGSTKMVGHAGSFLERKATDVLEVKKEKDEMTGEVVFTVKQGKVRGEDFEDWQFKVYKDEDAKFATPHWCNMPIVMDNSKSAKRIKNITVISNAEVLKRAEKLMADGGPQTKRGLIDYLKTAFSKGSDWANGKVDELLASEDLMLNENNRIIINRPF